MIKELILQANNKIEKECIHNCKLCKYHKYLFEYADICNVINTLANEYVQKEVIKNEKM